LEVRRNISDDVLHLLAQDTVVSVSDAARQQLSRRLQNAHDFHSIQRGIAEPEFGRYCVR
jgi:hypothetical protein